MIFNNKIKKIITKELNKGINESFVAQEKSFELLTDFLTEKNINNHKELYKGYLENFNKVSAALDSTDRSNVNSNYSDYRSKKLDETYNLNGSYLHELYFANISDVIVFDESPSPKYINVNIVNAVIPIPNPNSRPGHNNPPEYSTMCFVPSINVYDIIVPKVIESKNGFFSNHFQRNCPLV